jgi:hypothetical protein
MHYVRLKFLKKKDLKKNIPGDQDGLLAIQLKKFFYSAIYNTATRICFVGLFDRYLT